MIALLFNLPTVQFDCFNPSIRDIGKHINILSECLGSVVGNLESYSRRVSVDHVIIIIIIEILARPVTR